MKKIFLTSFTTSVLFGFLVFTSCVKESIPPPTDNAQTSSRMAPTFGGFILPDTITSYGSLTGAVLPLVAQPKVYLIGNSTIELSLDNSGAINKNSVPAGDYEVYIQPSNLNYQSHTINGVLINPGLVTDIGTILLEYGGNGGGGGCEIGWGKFKPAK